jgi:hypothetical protein
VSTTNERRTGDDLEEEKERGQIDGGILNGLNNERMAATRHGLDWRVTGGKVFPDDLFLGWESVTR